MTAVSRGDDPPCPPVSAPSGLIAETAVASGPTAPTKVPLDDAPRKPVADIGVIGGSGFYEFLTDAEEVRVETPFGEPSEAVLVGEVAGRGVAFLPRHGRDHR